MKKRSTLLLIGTALALAACGDKQPAGQVVATVNGVEVTQQELAAEAQGVNLPQGADRKAAQQALLQRVIDRKLLAEEAKRGELDESSDYITQRMRLDETLLAQQYLKQRAQAIPQPTDSDLSKFMADNTNVFGSREQLLVDQIRMPPIRDPQLVNVLRDVHTQDGVAQILRQRGVSFQRGRTTIDTAGLPPAVMKQIKALPAGEPFVLPGQGVLFVNTVVDRRAVPVPPDQARTLATNGWREEQFRKTAQGKISELRKTAKIDYQPGYAPPAQGQRPAGAGAPGAPAAPAAGG